MQLSFGANKGSDGIGTEKSIAVLIVGLGPGAAGNVWIFYIAVTVAGQRVFMLKII